MGQLNWFGVSIIKMAGIIYYMCRCAAQNFNIIIYKVCDQVGVLITDLMCLHDIFHNNNDNNFKPF